MQKCIDQIRGCFLWQENNLFIIVGKKIHIPLIKKLYVLIDITFYKNLLISNFKIVKLISVPHL